MQRETGTRECPVCGRQVALELEGYDKIKTNSGHYLYTHVWCTQRYFEDMYGSLVESHDNPQLRVYAV